MFAHFATGRFRSAGERAIVVWTANRSERRGRRVNTARQLSRRHPTDTRASSGCTVRRPASLPVGGEDPPAGGSDRREGVGAGPRGGGRGGASPLLRPRGPRSPPVAGALCVAGHG